MRERRQNPRGEDQQNLPSTFTISAQILRMAVCRCPAKLADRTWDLQQNLLENPAKLAGKSTEPKSIRWRETPTLAPAQKTTGEAAQNRGSRPEDVWGKRRPRLTARTHGRRRRVSPPVARGRVPGAWCMVIHSNRAPASDVPRRCRPGQPRCHARRARWRNASVRRVQPSVARGIRTDQGDRQGKGAEEQDRPGEGGGRGATEGVGGVGTWGCGGGCGQFG